MWMIFLRVSPLESEQGTNKSVISWFLGLPSSIDSEFARTSTTKLLKTLREPIHGFF